MLALPLVTFGVPTPTPEASATGSFPVAIVGAVLAALIAGGVALYVRHKNQEFERQKLDLEKQKMDWEKEKLRLTWDYERQKDEEKRRKEEELQDRDAERDRLLDEAESDAIKGREASYRIKLGLELSQLKILDMVRPLDLTKIYVQVQIRERVPLRYVDEADLHAARGGHASAPGIESDLRSPRDAAPVTLVPDEALRRYHRVVVLGDPGAGKTTMLKHLAFHLVYATRSDGEASRLPAFVELRGFVDSGLTSIVAYIRQLWMSQYGFEVSEAYLEGRLECGELVLLLDGLDEILGEHHAGHAESVYALVCNEINRIAVRFPESPIAVTCRRHGWREGLPLFQSLEALDFDWKQVTRFVQGWFEERPGKGKQLLNALGQNQRLQALAANPLLLSLIAIVYEKDLELPERRSALYRRCVQVMLREWDSHRQIKRLSQFTTDRKEDLLKQIAWEYHHEGRRYFEIDDLLRRIAHFLPSVDISPGESEAILGEIASQYGLLKEQAQGWYGFLHLTLQEHFAAAHLLELGQSGVDLLVGHRLDPWWEEVILLFAGATADAGPLLRGIMHVGEGLVTAEQLVALQTDDLFHTDLLMAARCLGSAPRVAEVALRQEILTATRTLAFTATNQAAAKHAARILIEASSWPASQAEFEATVTDTGIPLGAQRAIIESLAESGRSEVGPWFLALLRAEPTADIADALIDGLGILRWQPAYYELLSLSRRPKGHQPERLIAAAARIPESGASLLQLLHRLNEFQLGIYEEWAVDGIAQAVLALADPNCSDQLFEAVFREEVGFFPRIALAKAYLATAKKTGLRRLMAAVVDQHENHLVSVPLMSAIADHLVQARVTSTVLDLLLKLLRTPGVSPAHIWFVSECLDQLPPQPLDDLSFDDDMRLGASGLAITRFQWGDKAQLANLRKVIESGEADLRHTVGDWHRTQAMRLWQRVIPLMVQHDRAWLIDALVAQAESANALPVVLGLQPAYKGLLLADAELGLTHLAAAVARDPIWLVWESNFLPPAALTQRTVGLAIRTATALRDSHSPAFSHLVGAIGSVAADSETVHELFKLLTAHPQSGMVYDALLDVSRRAKVRVMPDGRMVPYAIDAPPDGLK